MPIYLIQHGKSAVKQFDLEQSLTEEGITQTVYIAQELKKYNLNIDNIVHSEQKRAMQTAEALQKVLQILNNPEVMPGMNPMDDVIIFANKIKNNTIYVGHLPFMERLALYLLELDPDKLICKFQNSAVLCLDKLENFSNWHIKWLIVPEH